VKHVIEQYLREDLAEHERVLEAVAAAVLPEFTRLAEACRQALGQGHKMLFFGNGGSAADAQHLATELTVRYQANREALSAIALTTDTSTLTAIGNDFGFDEVFARQVQALCREGDVAIGLSTSGNSENVVRGLRAAKGRGAFCAAFTGGDGGRLAREVQCAIIVPSQSTARVQEIHILLGHVLCGFLEGAGGRL
jgi:D-sedoheptulose 7-phosphate isomerase